MRRQPSIHGSRRREGARILLPILLLLAVSAAPAAPHAAPPNTLPDALPAEGVVLREALVVGPVMRGGRSGIVVDPLWAQFTAGALAEPNEGDTVERADGSSASWVRVSANDAGRLQHPSLRGGYAWLRVDAPREQIVVLAATGHGLAVVNDDVRAGDPYGNGMVRVPIRLRAGSNTILLQAARGGVSARLLPPPSPEIAFLGIDDTVPDLVENERPEQGWVALTLSNGTTRTAAGLTVKAVLEDGDPIETPVSDLPPLSVRKTPVRLVAAPIAGEKGTLRVELRDADGTVIDTAERQLGMVSATDLRRVTFRSGIDGSVQSFVVRPARPSADGDALPGIILTLHGAGVEARAQAASYPPQSFAHVVAPNNRRPFGFDWEDWGRLDALEVLDAAQALLPNDPTRVYLSGHSMGGHGTWQLGVLYPERWAAIGPSAGWASFRSYLSGPDAPPRPERSGPPGMLDRAASASDTFALLRNLLGLGVYILHGDRDDNVPVAQARLMRERLGTFHPDFAYREQPGAGHWWGSPCVAWPPMLEFFAFRSIPGWQPAESLEFATPAPGVSARRRWLTIEQQEEPMRTSTATIRRDLNASTIDGTTANTSRLAIDMTGTAPDRDITGTLDGEAIEAPLPADGVLRLARGEDGAWRAARPLDAWEKGPRRSGPFKDAFRRRAVLVYGTRGTPEENALLAARARFDAETFWYRGNGAFEVVADTAFDSPHGVDPERNVVLYGNADTNAAWSAALGPYAPAVRRGRVELGGRAFEGDDLAVLMVRPRAGSEAASVGVVGDTGAAGIRLSMRLPLFVSGIGWPDATIVSPAMLHGDPHGLRAAGFFGNDWSVERGTWAFGDDLDETNAE